MRRRMLWMKKMRDEIVHGVTIGQSKGPSQTVVPIIVNVDAAATVFAQKEPVTKMVIPKRGPYLHNEEISSLGMKLHREVTLMRTFQTVVRAADREMIIEEGEVNPVPGTAEFVQETAGANPAWKVGRHDGVGEFVGEFVMAAATLERALRTLELMHTGKLWRNFESIEDTDVLVQRWQERPSRKSITFRLRKILKRKPALRKRIEEFYRYRNFLLHNPLSATGREPEDWIPAFVDRRLVAVRDAALMRWEERKALKIIPQWAWDRQQERGLVYASMQSVTQQKAEARQLIGEINNMAYRAGGNSILKPRRRSIP